MAKKKDPGPGGKKIGRPRSRAGNEVQVSIQLSREDHARLSGLIEWQKEVARKKGTPVGDVSIRLLLLDLWRKHWKRLPEEARSEVEEGERYTRELKRLEE